MNTGVRTEGFRVAYVFLVVALGGMLALGALSLSARARGHRASVAEPLPPPSGRTSFEVSKTIAKRMTRAMPAGLEPNRSPVVAPERPEAIHLAALQVQTEQGAIQLSVATDDVVYQICGHGSQCSLLGSPARSRELALRQVALDLAVQSFTAPHAPQRVLVSLPAVPGQLWFVVFDRSSLKADALDRAGALLGRLAGARHEGRMPAADARQLSALTDGHTFAVAQQVPNEDGDVIDVIQPRGCMDASCPAS